MGPMDLCIVPMKPLGRAKLRLAGLLVPEQRRALSLAMLADVVVAAQGFDAVWVLNSDQDAADVARAAGAEPRPDPTPDGGLNASLNAATADAVSAGATGILIVSADLPAVSAETLGALRGPGVALAPDRGGSGTNALWRTPPDVIPTTYGPGSRAIHEQLAVAAAVPFRLAADPLLALDVDTPDDLRAAIAAPVGPATRAALETLAATGIR